MKRDQDSVKASRRHHDQAFKQELVRLSLEAGASVSAIAMRSGINANMLFKWRREHVRAAGGTTAAVLLPVTVQPVSADNAMATSIGPVPPQLRSVPRSSVIELEFAGAQVRLRGAVDEDSLRSVLRVLRQSA